MADVYVATFDSNAMFGVGVRMTLVAPPRRRQFNMFPGINGAEALDFGSTMRQVHVTGRLAAPSLDALGALVMFFANYQNENSYVLVTTKGLVFPQSVLHEFQEASKVYTAWDGTRYQDYRATFLDLMG